ncbi:DMT family transporter [Alphaproteobacteria bacterium]|nr:DMT family transporter [Alphaproteobacteria bacterium]
MIQSSSNWFLSAGYKQGVFWAVLTALVSISNDVITKFVGTRLNGLEISFFRFFFSMLTVLPFMIPHGWKAFKTQRADLHIWRAVIGVAAIALYVFSLIFLPLAEVTVFSFTQPLFFMPIAILFLREKVAMNRWIAGLFGFIGILIVIQPGTMAFKMVSLLPMGAAILFAMLDMLAKKMVAKESTTTLLFYFALGTAVAAFVPALYVWQAPTMVELFWLFCLGAGANLIQVCLFRAFAATDASSLVPFRYTELVFATAFGYLLFGELPSMTVYMGAAVIIASTLYLSYSEIRRSKKNALSLDA